MEYVVFILIILFLVFLLVLLSRIEKRTKNHWRKTAYAILEMKDPAREDILKTIKNLRLYGGRIKRDQEFKQLIERLQDKLEGLPE
jgi:cbb3-type cytochrome oxidase subunit 3